MAKGTPPIDEERLPWLEPYREDIARQRKVARRSHGGLVAVAGAFAVLFAAAGGFWFSKTGDKAPKPTPTRIADAPLNSVPVVTPPPVTSAPVAPTPVAPAPAVEVPPPAKADKAAVPAPKRVAAKSNATAPRPVARDKVRPWPKMPSPGPAGQVVQLGAFSTPARANAAYQTRLARYPMLGSMPRVVVPVATKPHGQVLYVLRLGTTSRQQSSIVCRNLRTSGDPCIVIG